MAGNLPPELLFQIATLLQNDGTSLVPCTSVCRSWQAAFEPLIYSSLAVYSDDEHKERDNVEFLSQIFENLHLAIELYGKPGSENSITIFSSPMKSWTGLHAERRIVLKLIASKTLSERLMIKLFRPLWLAFSKSFIHGTRILA